MQELNRGLTGIYSQGIYSQKDRKMLFCVVGKKEIVKLKELVEETDPGSICYCDGCKGSAGKRVYEKRYRKRGCCILVYIRKCNSLFLKERVQGMETITKRYSTGGIIILKIMEGKGLSYY